MIPDKKFFAITLYPSEKELGKEWFIKYWIKDYDKGKLVPKKYRGLLNLEPDLNKRLVMASNYIKIFETGEMPPSYKGHRHLPASMDMANSTFANPVKCCLNYIDNIQWNITPRTVSQYQSKIRFFKEWLEENKLDRLAIGAITRDHARAFLNYLKADKKLSNKTYNDYKILLGSVWQDYINDGKIRINPWRAIKSLENNSESFLSYPDELRQNIAKTLPAFDFQLYLVMMLEFYCAVRPHQEARLLQAKHLSASHGTITVPKQLSKNRSDRTRVIPRQLYKILKQHGYLNLPPDTYLFTRSGKPGAAPVTLNHFRNQFVEYRNLHSIPAKYKLYGAKHTGGMEMAARFSAYEIKTQMGHNSLAAQEHYTKDFDWKKMGKVKAGYPDF